MTIEPLPYGIPVLLDTATILQVVRDNEVGRWIDQVYHLSERWKELYVSAITVGELITIALRNSWSNTKIKYLLEMLGEMIIFDQLTPEVIQSYTELSLTTTRKGWSVGQNDLWIAAFAKTYDMVLLTLDHDFDGIKNELYELRVIDY